MSAGWIKLWRSAADHPCLQRADELGLWASFLMRAAHKAAAIRFRSQVVQVERGQLVVSMRAEAKRAGLTHARIRTIVDLFIAQGMLKVRTDPSTKFSMLSICNFEAYQDDSAHSPHIHRTVSAQSAHTEQEEEESKKGERVPSPAGDPLPLTEAAAIWNRVCGDVLPKVSKLTPTRKTALRRRLADDCGGDLAVWERYCRRIRASAFLTGENSRSWRADFDFAIEARSFVKIAEGKYDNRDLPRSPKPPPNGGGTRIDDSKLRRAVHERLKAQGIHPDSPEGLREQGGIVHEIIREMSHAQRHAA